MPPSHSPASPTSGDSRKVELDLLAFFVANDRDPRIYACTFALGLHPLHWADADACRCFYDLGEDGEISSLDPATLKKLQQGASYPNSSPWGEWLDPLINRLWQSEISLPMGTDRRALPISNLPLPIDWKRQLEAWVERIRHCAAVRCLQQVHAACAENCADPEYGIHQIRQQLCDWNWSPLWARRAVAQTAAAAAPIPSFRTGIRPLDAQLGSLQPRQLLALVSRPGTGKRSLLLQMLINQPPPGDPARPLILFCSPAKARAALQLELQAILTGIPASRLRCSDLSRADQAAADKAAATVDTLPAQWLCDPNLTTDKIAQAVHHALRVGQRPLVMVDYLQLIDIHAFNHRDGILIHQLLHKLQILAQDHAVPIICSVQVDKLPLAGNGAPDFSSMRQLTPAIEQVVDTLITMPDVSQRGSTPVPCPAELHILKNRFGAEGRVILNH